MKQIRLVRKGYKDYLTEHSADPILLTVHRIRRIVGWLLVFVLCSFLMLNMQLFSKESIQNIRSSLQTASMVSAGDTTIISYPAGETKYVMPFGNGLAICSDNSLYFQLPSKYTQMDMGLGYANPVMRASSRYLLVFDRSGNRFTVTNTLSQLYTQSVRSPILNADIAANGNVAIVTDEAGYRSAVEVYNIDNELLYKWSSPDYYIMSAVLCADGQRLALFCFKQDGLSLTSRLFFTDINSSDSPENGVDMNSNLVLGMKFLGTNTVCAVCDNGTYLISRNGQIRYQQEYASDDLIGFDMTDNCIALALDSYSQTSRAAIVLIDARGTSSRNPLLLPEAPDSISYSNGRLAVLTGDTVTFYSKSLREIDRQTNLAGVSRVYMRSGGTAIALFNNEGRVLSIGNPLKDMTPDEN